MILALVPLIQCLHQATPDHPLINGFSPTVTPPRDAQLAEENLENHNTVTSSQHPYIITASQHLLKPSSQRPFLNPTLLHQVITEGSMVYYYSRRYEQLTQTVQLFKAVVVAVSPPPPQVT